MMTTVDQAARNATTGWLRCAEPATRGDAAVLAAEVLAETAGLRSEIAAQESRLLWGLLGGDGALVLLPRLADLSDDSIRDRLWGGVPLTTNRLLLSCPLARLRGALA